ncbi:uncharacterized protein LOC136035252 isoform X2 [Artemia franciscana]|uniref:uncharacterized protein LOC136035252 isoform X2 n=1 Tax=Artemia franciscana TaxID=6661 RepID=UPI0032DACEC8
MESKSFKVQEIRSASASGSGSETADIIHSSQEVIQTQLKIMEEIERKKRQEEEDEKLARELSELFNTGKPKLKQKGDPGFYELRNNPKTQLSSDSTLVPSTSNGKNTVLLVNEKEDNIVTNGLKRKRKLSKENNDMVKQRKMTGEKHNIDPDVQKDDNVGSKEIKRQVDKKGASGVLIDESETIHGGLLHKQFANNDDLSLAGRKLKTTKPCVRGEKRQMNKKEIKTRLRSTPLNDESAESIKDNIEHKRGVGAEVGMKGQSKIGVRNVSDDESGKLSPILSNCNETKINSTCNEEKPTHNDYEDARDEKITGRSARRQNRQAIKDEVTCPAVDDCEVKPKRLSHSKLNIKSDKLNRCSEKNEKTVKAVLKKQNYGEGTKQNGKSMVETGRQKPEKYTPISSNPRTGMGLRTQKRQTNKDEVLCMAIDDCEVKLKTLSSSKVHTKRNKLNNCTKRFEKTVKVISKQKKLGEGTEQNDRIMVETEHQQPEKYIPEEYTPISLSPKTKSKLSRNKRVKGVIISTAKRSEETRECDDDTIGGSSPKRRKVANVLEANSPTNKVNRMSKFSKTFQVESRNNIDGSDDDEICGSNSKKQKITKFKRILNPRAVLLKAKQKIKDDENSADVLKNTINLSETFNHKIENNITFRENRNGRSTALNKLLNRNHLRRRADDETITQELIEDQNPGAPESRSTSPILSQARCVSPEF